MLPLTALLVFASGSTLADVKAKAAVHELALVRKGDLYLAKGSGQILARIAKGVGAFVWSRDGKWIAYQSGDRLSIRDLSAGKTTQLPLRAGGDIWLSFDPERPYLVVGGVDDKLTRISLQPRSYGLSVPFLAQRDSVNQAVAWSPDGRTLAFTRDGDVWIAKRTATHGDAYYDEANRLAAIAFYNDVELGVSAGTPIWADGLRWSPDGKRLVFHYQRQGGTGVSQIGWIALQRVTPRDWSDANGYRARVRWLRPQGDPMLFSPDVMPDGKALSAIAQESDGKRHLEIIRWDGRSRIRLLDDVDAAQWRPARGGRG